MDQILNNYFIYWHKKADDNYIFYIGQGVKKGREKSLANRNNHWQNTVKKHGFVSEIISNNLTKQQADNLEKFLIKELGRQDLGKGPLVNMTDGADGVFNISNEVRRRMSLLKIGKYDGEKNPMFGKTFKHTDEAKEKIRKSSIGRLHSQETKDKLSGKNSHMFGKTFAHTDDSKKKIGLAFKGKKQKQLTCPHCNKIGGTTMYRWHFDNCKNINT